MGIWSQRSFWIIKHDTSLRSVGIGWVLCASKTVPIFFSESCAAPADFRLWNSRNPAVAPVCQAIPMGNSRLLTRAELL
ncbi:hypothetical protein MATL_G00120920 [Megalops atlanticus]|uniref:Uncharacterized protein n=1 Tax=Megalops atlanticus TaxID=7932 RepID=A0A9D3T5Q6_MEGAT|nr:hypothetical protein MATL_G00120920 [Megalops atlanticus]